MGIRTSHTEAGTNTPQRVSEKELAFRRAEIMRATDINAQWELGRKYGFPDNEIQMLIKASRVNTLSQGQSAAWDADNAALAEKNRILRRDHILHTQRTTIKTRK